jgi:hypothetical protein
MAYERASTPEHAVECARCLLSVAVPGVRLRVDGLCSVCEAHDAVWGDWERRKAGLARELQDILDAARAARRPYDALVPLSGGKDSTYVLYLARRRYGLRCLAVTFDNGFQTEHARRNIRSAVDALQVDHVSYRVGWPVLRDLYRLFFLKCGLFCPVCMVGIAHAIDLAAAAYSIPLVLSGTSLRTEEHVAPEFYVPGTPDFYDAVMEGEPLREASPLGYRGDWRRRLPAHLFTPRRIARHFYGAAINLPDYVDWRYDEIFATISRELGWSAHAAEAEHADCAVAPAVDHIRRRKFPALVPELTRYSKLVTIGAMSKGEARARVAAHRDPLDPPALDALLAALQVSREEFESVVADPRRHVRFLDRARRSARARVRGVLDRLR